MPHFLSRQPIRYWPIFMGLMMLLLVAFHSSINGYLRFDENAIAQGQYWRLITAHFVHLGWMHGLLNVAGLLLVAWMQPKGPLSYWLGFYVVCSGFISMVLFLGHQTPNYVGASGVLHGLLILAAFFSQWLEPWRRNLMILLICLKLLWEQSPFYANLEVEQLIGGYVVVDAHFLGGLAAMSVLAVVCFLNFYKNHRSLFKSR